MHTTIIRLVHDDSNTTSNSSCSANCYCIHTIEIKLNDSHIHNRPSPALL